jgi:hypothetical protein
MHVDHEVARIIFLDELDVLLEACEGLHDVDFVRASRCRGWTVGDVLVHVHLGLQDMLLGLVSPTGSPVDTDAASYWRHEVPTSDPEADALAGCGSLVCWGRRTTSRPGFSDTCGPRRRE